MNFSLKQGQSLRFIADAIVSNQCSEDFAQGDLSAIHCVYRDGKKRTISLGERYVIDVEQIGVLAGTITIHDGDRKMEIGVTSHWVGEDDSAKSYIHTLALQGVLESEGAYGYCLSQVTFVKKTS